MKLAFTTLLVAGIELALFANVGSAYSTFSPGFANLAARSAGYDLTDSAFARSMYTTPELSQFSTRAIVEVLQDRIFRRDNSAKIAIIRAQLKKLGKVASPERTELLTQLKALLPPKKSSKGKGHKSGTGEEHNTPAQAHDVPPPAPPVVADAAAQGAPVPGAADAAVKADPAVPSPPAPTP